MSHDLASLIGYWLQWGQLWIRQGISIANKKPTLTVGCDVSSNGRVLVN
ncbi:MAG: hypothetical protein ACFFCW_24020 [Candidatus Hodarchaeota archaeon]